jgi:hypothetical protein
MLQMVAKKQQKSACTAKNVAKKKACTAKKMLQKRRHALQKKCCKKEGSPSEFYLYVWINQVSHKRVDLTAAGRPFLSADIIGKIVRQFFALFYLKKCPQFLLFTFILHIQFYFKTVTTFFLLSPTPRNACVKVIC